MDIVVGKTYRLKPGITKDNSETRSHCWVGEMLDLFDRKPRRCVESRKVSDKKTLIKFEEVGAWTYDPNDFEECSTIEVDKMELKDIKKKNLTEAKKQYDEEKVNAEIEFAKQQLRSATDNIDDIDRRIKALEEQKKPHLEILAKFA